jgi:ABC-type amino acid transport substrate-binding protein
MNEVAKRLQLEPVFVDTRWEVILGEMQRNRYDCIVGGITITPAREKILAWSTPYMTTTLSLVVDSKRMPNATSLADLKDATVGVQAATTDYDIAIVMQRAGQTPGLRIIAQVPDDPQPLGIGFNRNNIALLAAVNDALAGMQQDGSYQALVQRWGLG